MPVLLSNNAESLLAAAISDTEPVLTVTADADLFPTPGAGEYFYVTLVDPSGISEIVKVTSRVGNAFTIVRAQEDTAAQSFLAGSRVELRVTSQTIRDAINDSALDISGYFVADGTGTPVGLNVGAGKTLRATAGTLLLPSAVSPAQVAEGSVVWDTDDNLLTVGTSTGRKTLVDTDSTQTLTGKTLTSPTLTTPTLTSPTMATIVNVGTLTLPTTTDTLVGAATAATLTNKVINGVNNSLTVRLDQTETTGTLPVAKGGTGLTTLPANNVLLGNGASAVQGVAPGANGTFLRSDGTTCAFAALPTQITPTTGSPAYYAARAWVNFDGTTSPGTIRGSQNVSSITRNSTGNYTVNFTTNMPDANYCALITAKNSGVTESEAPSSFGAYTTSGFTFVVTRSGTGAVNVGFCNVAIFR